MNDSPEQAGYTPVDELTHFIVEQKVHDQAVAAEVLRMHGGVLRRLIRSVVDHPEFKEVAENKDVIERYHRVSQYLLTRDQAYVPTLEPEASPLEIFLKDFQASKDSKNAWLTEL